jgi:hypothetical protein
MRRVAALLLALAFATPASACRQALALGLDVSGSVDSAEYALQFRGLAAALTSPEVASVLLEGGAPVALAVYEWSGPPDQRLILPWTDITDAGVLADVAARIASTPRAGGSVTTAVGSAMIYGAMLLAERPDCPRHTLDISGDGLSNTGPHPRGLPLPQTGRPLTVNALAIGVVRRNALDGGYPGIAELTAWFRAHVIRGPGAFVEAALGFADFEAAMTRKLLRELDGMVVGDLGEGTPDGG